MRVVVLCSSPYSETGCAVAARLAQCGYAPVGALTLPSWDRRTLVRKVGQWGLRDSYRYAVGKLAPGKSKSRQQVRNPYLENTLRHDGKMLRNLSEISAAYRFPLMTCSDQNSLHAIRQMTDWSPDVMVFTGGDILRDQALKVPRLGVLNAHLARLPEIRGMSSPEWSLLNGVPLGITIHFMDSGIDTGPILLHREFSGSSACDGLADLRNKMIAEGMELLTEAVAGLDRGTTQAVQQSDREKDNQYFVMHERLKDLAAHRLKNACLNSASGGPNG